MTIDIIIGCIVLFIWLPVTARGVEQAGQGRLQEALVRSGDNRPELEKALRVLPGADMKHIIARASQHDLVNLSSAQLVENVEYARKVRQGLRYLDGGVPEDLWRDWVLPHRILDEDLECWRKELHQSLMPAVANDGTCEEAAISVLKWVWSDHGNDSTIILKSDTAENRNRSVRQLFASRQSACREFNLLYVAALRAAGIPARHCMAGRWIHRDSYHFYCEYWDVQKKAWVARDTTDGAVERAQAPADRVAAGRWNALNYCAYPGFPGEPDLYGKCFWGACESVTSNIAGTCDYEVRFPAAGAGGVLGVSTWNDGAWRQVYGTSGPSPRTLSLGNTSVADRPVLLTAVVDGKLCWALQRLAQDQGGIALREANSGEALEWPVKARTSTSSLAR